MICWIILNYPHTWVLPLCKAHFNCLKQKHQATRTAKGHQKLFLSEQISLHFQEPVQHPHTTVSKGAPQLRGPWGSSLAVHGSGWAFLTLTRYAEEEQSELRAASWQAVTSPDRWALGWELQRCAATSATAERHCLSPPLSWVLFNPRTAAFPPKCQSVSDWRRDVKGVGKICHSSSAPPGKLDKQNAPTHHQTASTQLTQSSFF